MNEYIEVRVVNEDGEEARFSWYRDDTMTMGMAGPIPELVRGGCGAGFRFKGDIAERLGTLPFHLAARNEGNRRNGIRLRWRGCCAPRAWRVL